MGRNTVAISITARLHYLLITVKLIALEKVSFSDTSKPNTFLNIVTVAEKHYLLTRDK